MPTQHTSQGAEMREQKAREDIQTDGWGGQGESEWEEKRMGQGPGSTENGLNSTPARERDRCTFRLHLLTQTGSLTHAE